MSLIMAVGNEDRIIAVSDGRVSDMDSAGNNIVLRENQCKIHRLSDKTVILFAGVLSQCYQVVSALNSVPKTMGAPQFYSEVLCRTVQKCTPDNKNEINVKLIIAGLNDHGKREWWSHKIDANGLQYQPCLLDKTLRYLALGDIDPGEHDYIQDNLNNDQLSLQDRIKMCFQQAAQQHQSINTKLYWELI